MIRSLSFLVVYKNNNWDEPERAPHWSNGVPCDVYVIDKLHLSAVMDIHEVVN